MARTTKFNVFTDAAGQWRWHLVAGNGLVICQGESHPTKQKAIRAAEGVKAAAGCADVVVVDAPAAKDAKKAPAKPAAVPSTKKAGRMAGVPMTK